MTRRLLASLAAGALTAAIASGCLPETDTAPTTPPPTSTPGDYDRSEFGSGWIDADGDGCDTREEVLLRDAVEYTLGPDGCIDHVVILGPYTGQRIEGRSEIDVDHVFALANAWESGAWAWTDSRREAFANDENNLLAVQDNENQSKGSRGPDEWRPPRREYWCAYAGIYEETAARWQLQISAAEREALDELLATCGGAP